METYKKNNISFEYDFNSGDPEKFVVRVVYKGEIGEYQFSKSLPNLNHDSILACVADRLYYDNLYDRIRSAVTTPPEYIKDLVERSKPLDFKPYPCDLCGELVECGIMSAVNHFNTCKKNKIII